jgi:hypothetical protein
MEPEDDIIGIYSNLAKYDPLTTVISSTGTGNGLWSQINSTMPFDPTIKVDPLSDLISRVEKLELNEKILRLKILSLQDKFTQEEVTNIVKMLMSEDEASRTLAESIIENAEL